MARGGEAARDVKKLRRSEGRGRGHDEKISDCSVKGGVLEQGLMPLTMLPTGLASPDYQDRQDWTIYADGSGRVPTFGLAKADWLCSWMACSKQRER